MSNLVRPIRLAKRKLFIPTVGLMTLPCGMSISSSGKRSENYVRVHSVGKKEIKHLNVGPPTVDNWLAAINEGIQWLEQNRDVVLIRWPLRKKVEGGPIPGTGLPGVCVPKNSSLIKAYNPVERIYVSVNSLNEAVDKRNEFVELFYKTFTFDQSRMFD